MSRLRPIAVASTVVVTELLLTVGGSELAYQSAMNGVDRGSIPGVLLNSVGVPWSAPWRPGWSFSGLSSTVGAAVFLLLAGLLVAAICRGIRAERPFLAVFLGTWGTLALTLAVSQIARYLVGTDVPEESLPGGNTAVAALTLGPSVHHAVYVGWLVALIAAVVATVSRVRDRPAPAPGFPGGGPPSGQPYQQYAPQYGPPPGGPAGGPQYGPGFSPPPAPSPAPPVSPLDATIAVPQHEEPSSSRSGDTTVVPQHAERTPPPPSEPFPEFERQPPLSQSPVTDYPEQPPRRD